MDDIYKLLAAQITGESISNIEIEKINHWLANSEKNQEIFLHYKQLYISGIDIRRYGGINVKKDYELTLNKIKLRRKNRIFNRISIASSILIIFCFTFYLQNVREKDSKNIQFEKEPILSLQVGDTIYDLQSNNLSLNDYGIIVKVDSGYLENKITSDIVSDILDTLQFKIVVPLECEYKLKLSDGTMVYLNAGTEFIYPAKFNNNIRKVHLKGEGYFDVQKEIERKFIVETDYINIEVLGTSFNINNYSDSECLSVTLVSGSIQTSKNDSIFLLSPDEHLSYNKKSNQIDIEKVNVLLYSSWKDGFYYFKETQLKNIMDIISRWYGITCSYEDETLKEIEFSGRLSKYVPLEIFLENFISTGSLKFKVYENHIYVYQ